MGFMIYAEISSKANQRTQCVATGSSRLSKYYICNISGTAQGMEIRLQVVLEQVGARGIRIVR